MNSDDVNMILHVILHTFLRTGTYYRDTHTGKKIWARLGTKSNSESNLAGLRILEISRKFLV